MPWAAWASMSCRSACDLGKPGVPESFRASAMTSFHGAVLSHSRAREGADTRLELLLPIRLWPRAPVSPARSSPPTPNPPFMVLPSFLQGEPGKAGEKGLPGAPGLRVSSLPHCPRVGASWIRARGAPSLGLLPGS